MLYYLDTMIVIYAVEGNTATQQRATQHLSILEQNGHQFAISDLTRSECLVQIFGAADGQRLLDFDRFFNGPHLHTITPTASMFSRASAIRGRNAYPAAPNVQPKKYGLLDSLHLAIAIESGCQAFLTNDNQLHSFQDLTVEELP